MTENRNTHDGKFDKGVSIPLKENFKPSAPDNYSPPPPVRVPPPPAKKEK